MMIRWHRFNIYLLLLTAAGLVTGCKTAEQKVMATLRVHLEAHRDGSERNRPVPIYRSNPFMVNIEASPILTEADVKEARVIDTVGGFALQIQFNRKGTWILEQNSVGNRGKRMAIFSQFTATPGEKASPGRWLGAPKLTGRISDGLLVFTPDATRDEAHQIVLGLNNYAKENDQKETAF